jgi:hypothetical protein
VKIREYSGPLTVLAAGVLGFSLICIVSAAALANPGASEDSDLGARDIVDSAFSNPISTAVAMTAVEIFEYIPTPTTTFTATAISSITPITYITPTRPFVTWTAVQPTRTRMGRLGATPSPSPAPTRFLSQTPTRIAVSTSTFTRVPTSTFTSRPPTETPIPPTHTQQPTDTPNPSDTPEPPTDTPEVIDTTTPPGDSLP